MGKDLKGKELGTGLAQRKDGRYTARFVTRTGYRKQSYFDTLPQARDWLQNARYNDKHKNIIAPFDMVAKDIMSNNAELTALNDMTVDEFFEFWMNHLIPDLRSNTKRNYRDRYIRNIQPVIGRLKVGDVYPFHCKKILLDMEDIYSTSTIIQTYNTMRALFKTSYKNGIIDKYPLNDIKCPTAHKHVSNIKVLTIEEQDKFLEAAKMSRNYDQYVFLLQTGLLTGELIGLTWDSVDLKSKIITIDKSLEYRYDRGTWEAGPPKTTAGYRTIPLTSKAYDILTRLYDARKNRYEAPELDTQLEFKDRLTDEIRYLNMKDLVFINRKGMPTKSNSYDTDLYKVCDIANIKHISMYVLRHSFATRAVERGIQPKILQLLLGHASLQVTIETYIHIDVTENIKIQAIEKFDENESKILGIS